MSEFRIDVIAATQKAERSLKAVERVADKATRERKLNIDTKALNKNFASISKDIGNATNNIKTFYSVSKKFPLVGGAIKDTEEKVVKLAKSTGELAANAPQAAVGLAESAKAGNIVSNTFKAAANATGTLINRLAKVGFAIYAVKEAAGVLQTAFGTLFNETIGRAARFQQTLLKTQTTLASTSKVFVNDVEITDPLEKIKALQKEIQDRVDSIRIRSIDLAGVTSNEVVEVFGLVASQISQINGDLKDAENLALQFSAALGTFNIPLYQARQEIGSILRGDITVDSYLAKALLIESPDIAKAKGQIGGVVKFLEDKLATAVAGQEIAARGLEGVLSNIQDIVELVSQALGEPLLDPLIAASSALYDVLFDSKDLLQNIGRSASGVFARIGDRLVSAFKSEETGEFTLLGTIATQSKVVFETLKKDVDGLQRTVEKVVTRIGSALRDLATSLAAVSAYGLAAFRELVDAFIQLQLVSLESLISAVATLSHGLVPIVQVVTELLRGWADILRLPIVQYFAQIAATFAVLKATGVIAVAAIVTQLLIWATSIDRIRAKLVALGGTFAGVIKTITTSLGSLLLLLGQAATSLKALLVAQGADPKVIKQLNVLETQLHKVGRNAKGVAYNFRNLGASINTIGRSAGAFILNLIKANIAIIAVTVGITLLVDAFGRLKRAQEETRQRTLDAKIIKNYTDNIQGLNEKLSVTQQKAKDAALALANKNYDDAAAKIAELELKVKSLNATLAGTGGGRTGRGRRKQAARELLATERELAEYRQKLAEALAILEEEETKRRVRTEAQQRANLTKEIGELRRQIDNDLFQQRQALARKEVEIFRAAGELRIKQIERANAKLIEGEEGASQVMLAAVNQYISTRERGELSIEAAKKQLTIENANLDKLTSDYRYNMEKKIAELRTKSADYEKKSAEERGDTATGKPGSKAAATEGGFEIPDLETTAAAFAAAIARLSGAMARLQSITESATRENINEALEGIEKAFPKIAIEDYENQLVGLKVNLDAIAASSGDAFSPERIAIQAQGIQKNVVMQRELEQTFNGLLKNTKLNDAERLQIMTKLEEKYRAYMVDVRKEVELKQSILNSEQALAFITNSRASVEAIQDEIEALQLRNRLVAEGVAPELIDAEIAKLQISRELERISANLSTELATQLDLQTQLNALMEGAEGEELQRLQKRLDEAQAEIRRLQDLLKQVRGAGKGAADAIDARAAAQTAPGQKIKGFIAQAEEQLNDFEGMAIRVSQGVGDAVGNSLTNGIAGLIEGTTTIKDIFADFLKDIGQILLKEAAKMIATYVAIGVAKIFAGLGSATSGGGSSVETITSKYGSFGAEGAANAAKSLPPLPRANGGPVLGGQPYIVGERGPELFVPSASGMVLNNNQTRNQLALQAAAIRSNMTADGVPDGADGATRTQLAQQSGALRANAATRQQLIRQQNNMATNSTRAALSNPNPLDVRFESTVINNTEYVTAEQHRQGMAQAAEQGRALTLQALQNSVKSRRKVGLA